MQFSSYFWYKCDVILQPRSALVTSVGELTCKLRQAPDDVWIVDGRLRCDRALTGLRCLDELHVRYHRGLTGLLLQVHMMFGLDNKTREIGWRY